MNELMPVKWNKREPTRETLCVELGGNTYGLSRARAWWHVVSGYASRRVHGLMGKELNRIVGIKE